MLTLTISHNIFIKNEERAKLILKKPINVTGISVPVWFYKGSTSEPAQEVFCKYKIINNNTNIPISKTKYGYEINLPEYLDDKQLLINKLLDYKEGGCESIKYKEYNKVLQNNLYYNIVHFVEIKLIENLLKTIC